MNAYSARSGGGHCVYSGLLMTYVADLIIMTHKSKHTNNKPRIIPATTNHSTGDIRRSFPPIFAPVSKFAHDIVVPDETSALSKKEQVAGMFDRIAGRYDLLNRFLSGRLDVLWRRQAIEQLRAENPQMILDVATGTADLAITAARYLKPQRIIGIDISPKMLEIGRRKVAKLLLNKQIELQAGDSGAIKFNDRTFDAITVAFGVRNFEHLELGLREMYRVLRPGGKVVILEFSRPTTRFFRFLCNGYMKIWAPQAGRWLTKDKKAYQYLNNSVKAFPEGETFLHILQQVGFIETTLKRLSLGICTIYCGKKETGSPG